jgi:hypothetical protein
MRNTSSARPLSNNPTPELHQHVRLEVPRIDGKAFRPFWKVRAHLSVLYERGLVSAEGFAAGVVWRRWCEQIGRGRIQSWEIRVDHARASA